MASIEYKNGELYCKKCGSRNISVRAGVMVDMAICKNCGNEDYL
jgi:transcription elongation factor Elf1